MIKISEDELIHNLVLLSHNFYKVLEIDLNTDLFYEVKIDDREKTKHTCVQSWIRDFAKENVHPDDARRFIDFFDKDETKSYLETKWMRRCFYRRKSEDSWRWACIELIKSENYDADNDAIIILIVRDVEDYLVDFKEQIDESNL